jgi:hypothetical protein
MLIEAIVWASVSEFIFQNDLITHKGLVMDLSMDNRLSSAGANQLFRVHLFEAACRYAHPGACQKNNLLNKKTSFCQNPHRE